MGDENSPPDSLTDSAFKPRDRKRPFNSPNFHEDTLAAAFDALVSGQDSFHTKNGGNSSGSLSDTAFKPRERKRLFEKPNYHENTLALNFSNVPSSDQDSIVLPVRPRHLLKEMDRNLTFTASQSKENSIVSVCSFKKRYHGPKERMQPNFDPDLSFNETINQSVRSFSKSTKQPYRFHEPPDLTFGGISSVEASSQESSCVSSGNRSTTLTNSNFESSSLSSTELSNKMESSSNFCADQSASEKSDDDDESPEVDVTLTDPSSSGRSNASTNVSKSSETPANDIKTKDDSEYGALSVSERSVTGEIDLSSASRFSRFRNTGNTFTKNDISDLTDVPVRAPEELQNSPATPAPVTEERVLETASFVHDNSKISESHNHNLTYTISVVRESSTAAQLVVPEQVTDPSSTKNDVPNPATENIEDITLPSQSNEHGAKVDGTFSVLNVESMISIDASQDFYLGLESDSHLTHGSIRNISRASNDLDVCESRESVVLLKSADRPRRLDSLKIPNRHVDFNAHSVSQITEGDEEGVLVSQESVFLGKPEERRRHLDLLKERSCRLDFDATSSQTAGSQAIGDNGENATVSQESVVLANNDRKKRALDLLRDKRCSVNFSLNQSQSVTLSETVFDSRKRFQFDAARADDLTFSMPASQQSVDNVSSATYGNLSALIEEESLTGLSRQNTNATSMTFEIVEPSQVESEKVSEIEMSKFSSCTEMESDVSGLIHSQSEVGLEEFENTLKPEDRMQISCDVSKNKTREDTLELEENVVDISLPQSNTSKSESSAALNDTEVEGDVIDLMHPESNVSKNESHISSNDADVEEDVIDLMNPQNNASSKNESHQLPNEQENEEEVVDLLHPQSNTSKNESHVSPKESEVEEDAIDLMQPQNDTAKNESHQRLNESEDETETPQSCDLKNRSLLEEEEIVQTTYVDQNSPSWKDFSLEEDAIDREQPENDVSMNESEVIGVEGEQEENVIDLLQPQSDETINSGNLSRFIQSESRIQTFSESVAKKESEELRGDTRTTVNTSNAEHLSRLIVSETDIVSLKSTMQETEIQDGTCNVMNTDDSSYSVPSEVKKPDPSDELMSRKFDNTYTIVNRTSLGEATHVTGKFDSLVNVSDFGQTESISAGAGADADVETTLVPTPENDTSVERREKSNAESLDKTLTFRDVAESQQATKSLLVENVAAKDVAESIAIESMRLPGRAALIGHSYSAPPRPSETEIGSQKESQDILEIPGVESTSASTESLVPKRRSSRLQAKKSMEVERALTNNIPPKNEVSMVSCENFSPNQSASTSRKRKVSQPKERSRRSADEELASREASLAQPETLTDTLVHPNIESSQWESGVNVLGEERETIHSSVLDNDSPGLSSPGSNNADDVEGRIPVSSDVLQETPMIPARKARRLSKEESSQNNTKRSSSPVPPITVTFVDTPVPTRRSDRLSKRKSPDYDSDANGVSFAPEPDSAMKDLGGLRKSTRLSTKAVHTVRFVDTFHSISTIDGATAANISITGKLSVPPCRTSSTFTTRSSTTSSEPSLVNKLFAKKDEKENEFALPTSTAPKTKKTKKKADLSDRLLPFNEDEEMKALPKKPNFPRLADYIHKGFYKVLANKMQPRYGIETNAKVVAFARVIKSHVDKIRLSEERYPEEEVIKFKRMLARQGIVETNWEFWRFSHERLPRDFHLKAFPLFVFKDGKRQLRDESRCYERILSDEDDDTEK